MHKAAKVYVLAVAAILAAAALPAAAQDEGGVPEELRKAGGEKGKKNEPEYIEAAEEPVIKKTFTREQVRRICAKYNNQLIAYYGDVWQVLGCERRPLLDNKTVYTMQRTGFKVSDVDGDVIAAIPEGEPLDLAISIESARGCKELNSRYVSFSNVDVYWVERCKKRLFPDWTTYIKHRDSREDKKGEILSLSWIEFDQLQDGEPMTSALDDIFAKGNNVAPSGVDIIPVDEACDGIDGKVVSYYARLYKIERCRKREVSEPELFFKRNGWAKVRVPEMTSEQWISLPDGAPIENKTNPVVKDVQGPSAKTDD